jgi:3-deoxy-manno-octulosonate cytidylyltransferase (CMP-KDO synthetase)
MSGAGSGEFQGGFGVVIPARFASSRLPGKPLRELAGKPMILHVLDRAAQSGADFVVVATDDQRIAAVVTAAGGEALLTSPAHASGTDRIAEVVQRKGLPESAIVVNIQGDEPLVDPELMRRLAEVLRRHPDVDLATVATPIRAAGELVDPNVVKVVTDCRSLALYFSRSPIPCVRDWGGGASMRQSTLPPGVQFLRHIGMYGYRVAALLRVAREPPAPAERAELLEQLRALWLRLRVHVSVVADVPSRSVDTEEDLARVEHILRRLGRGPSLRPR